MAGYSPNPLFKKLGLKEGQTVRLINPPANYDILIGEGIKSLVVRRNAGEDVNFIHLFTNKLSELQMLLPRLKNEIRKDGSIWISWYKKSAKQETELTENIIRDIALHEGLVDVKVCAIDDLWSGLKLVYRLKDR